MPKKKQSHAQDNIYVIRQFAYVYGVTGILLLSRKKIQNATIQFFSLSKNDNNKPNHQNNVFYILHIGFTISYKTGQKIFPKALPPDPQEACP